MSDLFTTKQVDGYSAKFIRFAGPENSLSRSTGPSEPSPGNFGAIFLISRSKVGASNLDPVVLTVVVLLLVILNGIALLSCW